MAKYKVVYARESCIGAAACSAVCPEFWSIAADGKADLKGSKRTDAESFELVIDETALRCNLEAAKACPVRAIKIIDLETGKELA